MAKKAPKSFSIKDTFKKENDTYQPSCEFDKFKYMSYAEKLKHPLWQKKRLEIMQRDNFKCRSCSSVDKQLQIHHIIYINKYKNPWDYSNEFLITLCEDCHKYESEENVNTSALFLLEKFVELTNLTLSRLELITIEEYLLKQDGYTDKEALKMSFLKLIQSV